MIYPYVGAEQEVILGERRRLRCCDCGLVHDEVYIIRRGRLMLRSTRNERATAAVRRGKIFRLVRVRVWPCDLPKRKKRP